MTPTPERAAGFILAGGLSRRMGRDKSFCLLGKRPLIAHVIERLRDQVDPLAINAADPDPFAPFGLDVIPDVLEGHCGPLAGILTGMLWARRRARRFLLTVATDAPFVPRNLLQALDEHRRREGADIVCAASGGRRHPTIALWPVALAENLDHALRRENIRKIDQWTGRFPCAARSWPDAPFDPFFNINRAEDLLRAEGIARRSGGD